ncbi:MAG: DUF21 domain-containing protein, partial [Bacteroidia bacterium]|nr:DUF21 domain-containing protein [Bacteroidia bacterium]
MNTDDPYPITLQIADFINPITSDQVVSLVITGVFLLILVALSAFFSASENALFSLTNKDLEKLGETESAANKAIIKLLSHPKKLLATILTVNNFVNVTFVIIGSHFLFEKIFNFKGHLLGQILIDYVLITFVLLLFGEVVPKIYA